MALSAFQRSLVSLGAPYDRLSAWRCLGHFGPGEARRGAVPATSSVRAAMPGVHFTDAALPGAQARRSRSTRWRWPTDEARTKGLQRITQKPRGHRASSARRACAMSRCRRPTCTMARWRRCAGAIRHHYADGRAPDDARLKQTVSDAEISDLIAFLETLTDRRLSSTTRTCRCRSRVPAAGGCGADGRGAELGQAAQQPGWALGGLQLSQTKLGDHRLAHLELLDLAGDRHREAVDEA